MTRHPKPKPISLSQACAVAQKVLRDTDAGIAEDRRAERKRTNDMEECTPAVVPPPGRIVVRELKAFYGHSKNILDSSMTAHEVNMWQNSIRRFCAEVGLSANEWADLYHGILPLTEDLAEKLERVLGNSKQFWLNLERNYREYLERVK